jgi:hypothetical protein
MKKTYVAVSATVLGFCALAALIYFTFGAGSKPKPPPLELVGPNGVVVKSIKGCTDELPWSEPHKIKTIEHVNSELKVIVLINASCGPGTASRPIATFGAEQVGLEWSWWRDPNEPVAACLCTRAFEFTIPRVQGKTPKVVLKP